MTSPGRSYSELPPGSLAPDFAIPTYPGGNFQLQDFRSKGSVLLYFASGFFRILNEVTANLLALADRYDDFLRAKTRIVVVSRDEYPAAAADDFLNRYDSEISLLVDRDAEVGRLYGCHCLEPHFGNNFGYDRNSMLCFIESSGVIRLHTEVTRISSNDPPRHSTADELQHQQWCCEVSVLPHPISVEFLIHLGKVARRHVNKSESLRQGIETHLESIIFEAEDQSLADLRKRLRVQGKHVAHATLPESTSSDTGHSPVGDSLQDWGEQVHPDRIYEVDGHATVIIVPEDYAIELDLACQVRLEIEAGASKLDSPLPTIGMLTRALPEHFVAALDCIPDSSLIQRLRLFNHPCPAEKEHRRMSGDPSMVVLAAAFPSGDVAFYRCERTSDLRSSLTHEWAHLVKYRCPLESEMFRLAEELEKFGYHARDRAFVNNEENFAVHLGEEFLHRDFACFQRLAENAPVRTMVIGQALDRVFQRTCPRSPACKAAMGRVEWVRDHVRPRATERLVTMATIAADTPIDECASLDEVAHQAAELLVYMREGRYLRTAARGPENLSFAWSRAFGSGYIVEMEGWTWLRTLDLSGTLVGGRAVDLNLLTQIGQLETLMLNDTNLLPSGCRAVSRIKTLKRLEVAGTQIDDGACFYFSKMTGLVHLDVRRTGITSCGVAELRWSLPESEILFEPGTDR